VIGYDQYGILGKAKEPPALCSTESCFSLLIRTRSDFAEVFYCCALLYFLLITIIYYLAQHIIGRKALTLLK